MKPREPQHRKALSVVGVNAAINARTTWTFVRKLKESEVTEAPTGVAASIRTT